MVCLRRRFCLVVQNLGISLKLDLWHSTGFLFTRALPWWSSASSGLVVSSHNSGGTSFSARGQHATWSFLPLLAHEGHSLSFSVVVGGYQWFWISSAAIGLLQTAQACFGEHVPVPMTTIPNTGCFVVFWQLLVFFFCMLLSLFIAYLCNRL
jgi:hypothetical protein